MRVLLFQFYKSYSCSYWLGFSGNGKVSPEVFAEALLNLQPDLAIALGDMSHPTEGNVQKRLTKSHERTLKFLDTMIAKFQEADKTEGAMGSVPLLGMLVGGEDSPTRATSSEETAKRESLAGFAIPVLPSDSGNKLIKKITVSLSRVPQEKLRLVQGLGTLRDVLQAVSLGADLFDGVLAYKATQNGHALHLQFGGESAQIQESGEPKSPCINLHDPRYKSDFTPLDPNCPCYACREHTKAYIFHLLMTKEMLAEILLHLHNLSSLDRLMDQIRKSIQEGRFEEDRKRFLETYPGA